MSGKLFHLLVATSVCFSALPSIGSETNAPSDKVSMRDSEDGKLDMSAYLASAHGFLPVPIIITEPAIGYGGGLMLMFLHDSIHNRAQKVKERNPDGSPVRLPPPSVTGVMGFGTENGTWGASAFHMGIWKNDAIRYLGALAYASVNYDFYPAENSRLPVEYIPINMESAFLLQQMTFRLGKSDFLAGANYKLRSSTAKPDIAFNLPPPVDNGSNLQSSGASGILTFDNRDSIFTPDKGLNCEFEWTHYADWLGSDTEFNIASWKNRGWYPLTESLILGLRIDGTGSGGTVPFYMKPDIGIRGIQSRRYIGDYVLTAETELRWDFTKRWSAVGFIGTGWRANGGVSDFSAENNHPAGGVGFRYLIARVFQLRAGIDIAVSEEGNAFYITTGNGWKR